MSIHGPIAKEQNVLPGSSVDPGYRKSTETQKMKANKVELQLYKLFIVSLSNILTIDLSKVKKITDLTGCYINL